MLKNDYNGQDGFTLAGGIKVRSTFFDDCLGLAVSSLI